MVICKPWPHCEWCHLEIDLMKQKRGMLPSNRKSSLHDATRTKYNKEKKKFGNFQRESGNQRGKL